MDRDSSNDTSTTQWSEFINTKTNLAMSFFINISDETVTLNVVGAFDMSLGFAFWNYCQPDTHNYKCYVFNFSEAKSIRDSGIGWLVQFAKFARAKGARIEASDIPSEWETKCQGVGLKMKHRINEVSALH